MIDVSYEEPLAAEAARLVASLRRAAAVMASVPFVVSVPGGIDAAHAIAPQA